MNNISIFRKAIFISLLFVLPVSAQEWLIKEEFLSPDVEHFDCHTSTIVETAPGSFCTVWKGGPGEGISNIDIKENVGIWLSLFDGNKWTHPKEIVQTTRSVCWNPVLSKLPSGELLLFYRVGPEPRSSLSFMKRSYDGGVSWSKEELLPAGIVGPTKNKPIVTTEGTLICPSSMTVGTYKDEFKATACWIEMGKNSGRQWQKICPLEIEGQKFGVVEPALFFDKDGHLRMLCRDRSLRIGKAGHIWMAVSQDGGWTWSSLKATDLPNPDSGFDVVDLGEGKIVLIYNHSSLERFPLNLAISLDGGDHWSSPWTLETDSGEFPAAIVDKEGLIHVTYAFASSGHEQRRIKHVVIDPSKLISP